MQKNQKAVLSSKRDQINKIVFVIILELLFQNVTGAQDRFSGFWSNEDKTQIIKIYKDGTTYSGELIYRKEVPLSKVERKKVLLQMKKKNRKTLFGGRYFDHNIKKEYEVKLVLKDENTIFFVGYGEDLTTGVLYAKSPSLKLGFFYYFSFFLN